MVWGSSRSAEPTSSSPQYVAGAGLLGSFAGAIALAAVLAATATVAELFGASHPLNVVYAFVDWLVGVGPAVRATSLLVYLGLLLLLAGTNVAYYEVVLPYLVPRGLSRLWQIFGLVLLTTGVFGLLLVSAAFLGRNDAFDLWWQTGALTVSIGIACGVVVYALTAVYGRVLAIAATATFRCTA
jgi:hypothetical protein